MLRDVINKYIIKNNLLIIITFFNLRVFLFQMIIGLSGYPGSGKNTVAYSFVRKNFFHYSLSDILREELEQKGKEVTRNNLIKLGNQLRKRYGSGILAERVLQKVIPGKNYVISSIANPGEVNVLKKRGDFTLIFVDAPLEIRQSRIKNREREKDPKKDEDIKKLNAKHSSKTSYELQINKCKEMADIILKNDSTIEELKKKTNRIIKDLKIEIGIKRPSWDEYFMKLAYLVRERSTCLSRNVGAVIVKDKKILTTGYNGPPRGLKHCNERGGCLRDQLGIPPMQSKEITRAVHAEQNAIAQAASSGISVENATIYCTNFPCFTCIKILINAGIKEIVYHEDYEDPLSKAIIKEAKIKVRKVKL